MAGRPWQESHGDERRSNNAYGEDEGLMQHKEEQADIAREQDALEATEADTGKRTDSPAARASNSSSKRKQARR